jgi:hypothetical protein
LPPLLKKRGKPDDLSGALGYLRELIEPIGPDVYFVFESEARLRLRGRDETDWPTPAAATNGCFDPGKGTDGCYQVKLKATTCAAIIMSRLPISCPRVPTVA